MKNKELIAQIYNTRWKVRKKLTQFGRPKTSGILNKKLTKRTVMYINPMLKHLSKIGLTKREHQLKSCNLNKTIF